MRFSRSPDLSKLREVTEPNTSPVTRRHDAAEQNFGTEPELSYARDLAVRRCRERIANRTPDPVLLIPSEMDEGVVVAITSNGGLGGIHDKIFATLKS